MIRYSSEILGVQRVRLQDERGWVSGGGGCGETRPGKRSLHRGGEGGRPPSYIWILEVPDPITGSLWMDGKREREQASLIRNTTIQVFCNRTSSHQTVCVFIWLKKKEKKTKTHINYNILLYFKMFVKSFFIWYFERNIVFILFIFKVIFATNTKQNIYLPTK